MSDKGYAFSLDAYFALLILFLTFFVASFVFVESEPLGWQRVGIKRMAEDFLALMDAEGTLQELNEASLEADMNQLLLPYVSARIQVRSYEPGTLDVDADFTIGQELPTGRDIIHGRRVFVTFNPNKTVNRHGNVDYWVWFREV